jgi:hypothetical protein
MRVVGPRGCLFALKWAMVVPIKSPQGGLRRSRKMEAAGIEKDDGQPQTSCNATLYARLSASYGALKEIARKHSNGAFGDSMVPILGTVVEWPWGYRSVPGRQCQATAKGLAEVDAAAR